jgi:DNA-binding winged helix-turn-helix (wHTH) protein
MSGEMPVRIGGVSGTRAVARFGDFALDPATRRLTCGTIDVHLTRKAFDLLTVLVDEAPRVVPKAELHQRLWPGTFVSEATLVSLVKELRRALQDRDATAPIIRTAHGVGYACASAVDRGPACDARDASHWIDVEGRRIRLLAGENVIGRDPASRVWLDVASISRHHARILVGRDGAVLEDLGSKNRTMVGDTMLTGRLPLRDGDRILVGPVPLVYRASRTGLSTETQAG